MKKSILGIKPNPILLFVGFMSLCSLSSGSAQAQHASQKPVLLRTIRHKNQYRPVLAFSPNSTILATTEGKWTGSDENPGYGSLNLWDLKTGVLKQTLRHDCVVSSVVFSPNGKLIASGDIKGKLRFWNAQSGKLLYTLLGHSQGADVSSLAFSSNGKLLAVGAGTGMTNRGELRLWNMQSGKLKWSRLASEDSTVDSVAFSPDNTLLAEANYTEIKLRSVDKGDVKRTLTHNKMYGTMAFSADGKFLARCGGEDTNNSAVLWDVATGKMLRALKHPGLPWTVAFAPQGKMLATGTYVGNVRLWDAQSGKLLHTLSGKKPEVKFLDSDESDSFVWIAFSPNGKMLAVSGDKTVKLWSVK